MILVTGGTGTVGRHVVSRLRDAGQDVRVLSRKPGGPGVVVGDLRGDFTVDGADVIVHCASADKGDDAATTALVRAAKDAKHLVFVSIVGVDRLSFGYTRTKLECERIVAGSGIPFTTIRATQFFDLILRGVRKLAKLPLIPVPKGFVTQPVDEAEVAAKLVALALGEPHGRVPDFAGPEVLSFADLQRAYSARPVVPVWLPGTAAIRAGAMLPVGPDTEHGTRTWADYISAIRARK